jgi:hypothetical protein
MPKFTVSIAREETTLYYIDVEANDKSDAEDKAWEEFNSGCSSIIDHGQMVHADEYVDYVDNHENEEIQDA